jgi:hypothetical protein
VQIINIFQAQMTSVSVSDVPISPKGIDLRERIRLFEDVSVVDDATTAPQQNESGSAAKQTRLRQQCTTKKFR